MALELYASRVANVRRVFPVFLDQHCQKLDTSPFCVRPVASLQLAARLLRENGVEPRPDMFDLTVADIVEELKLFCSVQGNSTTSEWNVYEPDFAIAKCVKDILDCVQSVLGDPDSSARTDSSGLSVTSGIDNLGPNTKPAEGIDSNDIIGSFVNKLNFAEYRVLQGAAGGCAEKVLLVQAHTDPSLLYAVKLFKRGCSQADIGREVAIMRFAVLYQYLCQFLMFRVLQQNQPIRPGMRKRTRKEECEVPQACH